jgi:hypothetical protein
MPLQTKFAVTPSQNIKFNINNQKKFASDHYYGNTTPPEIYITRVVNEQLEAYFTPNNKGDKKLNLCGILSGFNTNLFNISKTGSITTYTFSISKGTIVLDSTYMTVESPADYMVQVAVDDIFITNGYTEVLIYADYQFVNTVQDNPMKVSVDLFNPSNNKVLSNTWNTVTNGYIISKLYLNVGNDPLVAKQVPYGVLTDIAYDFNGLDISNLNVSAMTSANYVIADNETNIYKFDDTTDIIPDVGNTGETHTYYTHIKTYDVVQGNSGLQGAKDDTDFLYVIQNLPYYKPSNNNLVYKIAEIFVP